MAVKKKNSTREKKHEGPLTAEQVLADIDAEGLASPKKGSFIRPRIHISRSK